MQKKNNTSLLTILYQWYKQINGNTIEYDLSDYYKTLEKIKDFDSHYQSMSDQEIKESWIRLSKKNKDYDTTEEYLDFIKVESFAMIKESIKRVLQVVPFDVQIIAGLAMHKGKLANMNTGEGKTLSAVFPACLNALSRKGVHILTFNDYLAQRDSQWMGPVYEFLGLECSFVNERMSTKERQFAYNSDITYLTAKESGFDFLRDNLCYKENNRVHRPFNFAIIDEADSILIDEARVPLIIAGESDTGNSINLSIAQLTKSLEEKKDYDFDEYKRNIFLTDHGIKKVEEQLHITNLYDETNTELPELLHCALHAEYLLNKNIDYIVRNEKVEQVDEFTGRVAENRRWPDGLQAALEMKENIVVQKNGKVLNTITLQHFLQLYPKICGMTATALSGEKELNEFYNLHAVAIQPHKQCIRIDRKDRVFKTKKAKGIALLGEIEKVHTTTRPILVGMQSVEESHTLAQNLKDKGISCSILNAKNDELEAEIIAQTGKSGAVTISTNMAGRGTDIRLGADNKEDKEKVLSLGGLYVIGTNRHESIRIDDQLRGRAGRQGDPGSSQFFVSLEDDIFIKYKLKDLIADRFEYSKSNTEINNSIITEEINRVQRIIEGQNLEIKKTLFKYSYLLERQRLIISEERNKILLYNYATQLYKQEKPEEYQKHLKSLSKDKLNEICRKAGLMYIDQIWSKYLHEISIIKEGIHLRSIGGENPLVEYQKISIELFNKMYENLYCQIIKRIDSYLNNENEINEIIAKNPSATWTYLINDDSFENKHGNQIIGDIGHSIATALWWPLLFIKYFKNKKKTEFTLR